MHKNINELETEAVAANGNHDHHNTDSGTGRQHHVAGGTREPLPISTANVGSPIGDAVGLINLSDLSLSQDFENQIGVKKLLTTVPVRKPGKFDWIRVHPEPEWRLDVGVLELKDENEIYLVHNSIVPEISGDISRKTLFTAINRDNDVSLWPVNVSVDGTTNDWNRSALEAAQYAMKHWVQVRSNRKIQAYEVLYPIHRLPEPEWPADVDFITLLNKAFKDRYITELGHPVLRRLRGEL